MTEFHAHPDVLTRKVGEEIVLVHMGRNTIYSLNVTGARLWELWSEGMSRADAVEQLLHEFDAPRETVEAEADRLLELLQKEELGGFDSAGS